MAVPLTNAVNRHEIHRLTTTLADATAAADLTTAVPTCGEWTLADLVWHLTDVQKFWTYIISSRPADPIGYTRPARGADSELVDGLRRAVDALVAVLESADPNESAWSWSREQTVGFTIRRQTHEALTHCVDGLLAIGAPLPPVPPELAADGIDEVLTVMPDGTHSTDDFIGSGDRLRLTAVDTHDAWAFELGRRGGQGAIELAASSDPAHTTTQISGGALELNLWLWGRGATDPLLIEGDVRGADELRMLIAESTQ